MVINYAFHHFLVRYHKYTLDHLHAFLLTSYVFMHLSLNFHAMFMFRLGIS